MNNLDALGLTPSQLVEIEQADADLVQAWLEHVLTAPGVKSPAGLLLSGVRSGNKPGQLTDEQERKAFVRAERFVRQVGYICETEDELRAELAERKWPIDERLVELWRTVRPIGERLERETVERAEHWKRTRQALQDPCKNTPSTSETHKPLHSSQVAMSLTAVRGGTDPDADIAW